MKPILYVHRVTVEEQIAAMWVRVRKIESEILQLRLSQAHRRLRATTPTEAARSPRNMPRPPSPIEAASSVSPTSVRAALSRVPRGT